MSLHRLSCWMCAACLLLLLLSPASLRAQPGEAPPQAASSPWTGPFFFVQMTDTQLGMYSNNKDVAQDSANYNKAVDAVNKLKPAFVVICGDLVNKAGDAAQIAAFKQITARFDPSIPVHLVAGNHDVERIPTAASLAFYRQTMGPDQYVVSVRGCKLIVLNSGILQTPAENAEECARQLDWLKTQLAAGQATHTLVFMHHPPFVDSIDDKDGYNVLPATVRRPFLDLLKSAKVTAVFAGHLHRNNLVADGDLPLIASAPVGKPLAKDPSGFRIVKVFEDRIEHEYVALDAVPEHVSLAPAAVGAGAP